MNGGRALAHGQRPSLVSGVSGFLSDIRLVELFVASGEPRFAKAFRHRLEGLPGYSKLKLTERGLLDALRRQAEMLLTRTENQWAAVSKCYMKLKLSYEK
jgi:hypothetical protein